MCVCVCVCVCVCLCVCERESERKKEREIELNKQSIHTHDYTTSEESSVTTSGEIMSVKVSTADIVISLANKGFPAERSTAASVIIEIC